MSDKAPPRSALAELNRHIARLSPPGAELRSVQTFRETWSRVSAEDQVTQAVQRGPENAGPLNSHMLVLRTLEQLRALSPDYVRRFVSQVDSLLWLDQAVTRIKPPAVAGGASRRKKVSRS